jgi:hypothetical protein
VHGGVSLAAPTKSAGTPVQATGLNVTPRRFHRVFGRRLPAAGIGIYYGPIYDPAYDVYPPVLPPPLEIAAPDSGAAVCATHIVVVPAEAGGERPIRVTQCGLH